ncbi:MAG: hypothetical protein J6Y02_19570 [Pseudobutyrivibrio sp.]|nr:hypothetical protein [Pseudobutyrivibrio sp.]
MARKKSMDHGNDTFSMVLDIIAGLTAKQLENEYIRLRTRYTNKGHTKLYNVEGEEDKDNGKVRLTRYQFKALSMKYGNAYMKKALQELTNYIIFMEEHPDYVSKKGKTSKQILDDLNTRTHTKELDGGWVFDKLKKYISSVDTQIIVNPFTINDVSVAKRYIESLSSEMRKMPDVMWLVEKFPELNDLVEE